MSGRAAQNLLTPSSTGRSRVRRIFELAALPVMFFLCDSDPAALIAILMVADGGYLLIYMWLHLDDWYFLAANAKVVLGASFLFGVIATDASQIQAAAGGAVSLVVAPLIWRNSQRSATLDRRHRPPAAQ